MAEGSAALEWPQTLDVRELMASGWRPTPFREFILKVHSRCNLACDYCYMYEMADQGWRRQPRRMARPTIDWTALRIAEHARNRRVRKIDVILHGGEPLLAGVDLLEYALDTVSSACSPDIEVRFHVQTNGVLLERPFLDLFLKYNVAVGVSLDGDEEGHDRHRRWANGQGSFQAIQAGLERLTTQPYRALFSGLLCTVDLRNEPIRTYEAMLEFEPPTISFLLPHGNWDQPPPGRPPDTSAPYGDWLVAVFDRWYNAPAAETQIRLFEQIIRVLCGLPSQTEAIGLAPVAVVVVETNGQLEQVDSLKSAFDGAAGTTLHVSRDPFETALMLPSIAARQAGKVALGKQCQSCHIRDFCGGGNYPHRYRNGTGFRNPSVYCHDLMRLITHMHDRVARDLE